MKVIRNSYKKYYKFTINMLSVKIEFCPLDWYSSSPIAIVLYKRMYMCKIFPSNRQKLKKRKCDLHEISSASPKAFRRHKRRNLFA